MKYSNTSGRYALLDELRGLDLVSMMLYHGCWDLVNLFGIQADWYYGLPGHLWQQSICWVFILLSGFCVQLGHHTLRRGAQVFGAGALVTVYAGGQSYLWCADPAGQRYAADRSV